MRDEKSCESQSEKAFHVCQMEIILRNPLVVQWLGLSLLGLGSVPSQGTKIAQAMQRSQKKKFLISQSRLAGEMK